MVPYIQRLVSLSILLSLFNPWARSEFFTAAAELEPLLETQKRIIDDLDDYITKEEKRLVFLKKYLEQCKLGDKEAMEDIPNYLGNPINAFTLIKRLTTDLYVIYTSIKSRTEYIRNISIKHEDVVYPTMEDLVGAVQGLTRLQVTYKLDVHDLAEGLNGVVYSHPMTAADCFELCRALYDMTDYKNSMAWGMETLRKYKEETSKKHSFTEVEVLEYIAFSYYAMGDLTAALEWNKKLQELDRTHTRAAENVRYFEKTITEQEAASHQGGNEVETKDNRPSEKMGEYAKRKSKYEALCRGEMEINSDVAKRCCCVLRLAPIKAEQVYIDPDARPRDTPPALCCAALSGYATNGSAKKGRL